FRSCNRNQAANSWCGRCPKCLSVFITMYPFISESDIQSIFGADLYAQEESIAIIRQLAGMEAAKPFECVGTTDEIIAALWLSVEKCERMNAALPVSLVYVRENVLPLRVDAQNLAATILAAYGPHRLPQRFEAILNRYDLR